MNEHNSGADAPWRDSSRPKSGAIEIIAAEDAAAQAHPELHPRRLSRLWWQRIIHQFAKFSLVGGLGFFVDMGIFNILRATVLSREEYEWGPLAANALSTLVAIVFNWAGNRFWTFRHDRRHTSTTREAAEFFFVSLVGAVIGLLPLWVTHYLVGWVSPLADNLAKVFGIGVSSIFRFVLYRWWVYSPNRKN